MNAPCRDCTCRTFGCHSKCTRYRHYKHQLAEIHRAQNAAKQVNYYVSESILHNRYSPPYGKAVKTMRRMAV